VIHRLRKSTGIDDIDMENALGLLGDLNSGKIIISGAVLGIYEGVTESDALDAMA
jgi:hypothetical protein